MSDLPTEKRTPHTVLMPKTLWKRVGVHAANQGTSKSTYIRRLIEDDMEKRGEKCK